MTCGTPRALAKPLHLPYEKGQEPSLRSRLRSGITWNMVASVFNQGSTFAVGVIIARLLGRTNYGEYAMVQSTLLGLSLLAQLATGATATKYLAEFRSSDKKRAGRVLSLCLGMSGIMSILTSLALFALAPWLAGQILNAPQLAPELMLGAGILLFSSVIGCQTGALAGLESYSVLAQAALINGLAYLIICTLSTWMWGLPGSILGLLLSAIIQVVVLSYKVRSECLKHGIVIAVRGATDERSIIHTFILPSAISAYISMPAFWVANAFLFRQPNGFSEMALYSAAASIRMIALFLPNISNAVGTSLLNNQRGLGDRIRFRKIFWSNLGIAVILASLVTIVGFTCGSQILRFFGKDFGDGDQVLRILLLGAVVEAAAVAAYQLVVSEEKLWHSIVFVTLPRESLILYLAYTLSAQYGAIGLATAYTSGWALALIMIIGLCWRINSSFAPDPAKAN